MDLNDRIRRLERRCRLLHALLGGLAVTGAVTFLTAASRPRELTNLQVRQLEVVDADGNVRIRLGNLPQKDLPQIYGVELANEQGTPRAGLNDLASLVLSSESRYVVMTVSDVSADFQVSGKAGKPRVMISASDEQAEIQIRDVDERIIFRQASEARQRITPSSDPFGAPR